ncbi:hypothetical protein NBRC10513v2_002606 [Rhodotorula toruloides]|uniref:NAD(P)-binding protein n=1 Tax=Rhodotorula toruloides TaxID=5286 RepID=A0A2T0A4L0_RHOTO|nr:NAD(P)-binding protein [Rhodotorula toruloides]
MPTFTPEKFGFIGMGNMGLPMARNLAAYLETESLAPLHVYNRTASKLPAESAQFKHVQSAKELARTCDVIVTSLAHDEAAKTVYKELFEGAKEKKDGRGIIFIDTSTLYPLTCGELERTAQSIPGAVYLCSPVFGPPPMAKDAKLVFVLSGDTFAKKKVVKFLSPSMGRRVIDVGNNVERAAAFKLCGNGMIASIIELLAEAMTLADRTGVGSDLLFEFIKEFLPAPSFIGYGSKILNNTFEGETGFTVKGGLKDVTHVRSLAQSVGATMPALDAAHRHLVTSLANGGGDLDWSSLVAGPRLAAGLQPFTGRKEHARDTGFGAKTNEPSKNELEPESVGGIKTVQNF